MSTPVYRHHNDMFLLNSQTVRFVPVLSWLLIVYRIYQLNLYKPKPPNLINSSCIPLLIEIVHISSWLEIYSSKRININFKFTFFLIILAFKRLLLWRNSYHFSWRYIVKNLYSWDQTPTYRFGCSFAWFYSRWTTRPWLRVGLFM